VPEARARASRGGGEQGSVAGLHCSSNLHPRWHSGHYPQYFLDLKEPSKSNVYLQLGVAQVATIHLGPRIFGDRPGTIPCDSL